MPYQANRDATIPKVIGTTRNAENEKVAHYESVTYPEGSVVFEQDIAPHVLRRLEDGDDHLSSLLRYIDEAEARQILGQQAQDAASEPVDEGEILHQEERMGVEAGGAPSAGPEFGTQEEPPYEAPPTGKGGSGADVGEIPEEIATTDETGSDDSGTEVETTEEVEQQTDAEAAEAISDDSQKDGQGQSDEVQKDDVPAESSSEETSEVEDQFTGLDKKALLDKAKEAKIPKRIKMDEDQLRAALREKAK